MEFTQAEMELMSVNGVSQEEVEKVLSMFPQSLDTAIGYIIGLKKGMGQGRSEPFTPTPEQTT